MALKRDVRSGAFMTFSNLDLCGGSGEVRFVSIARGRAELRVKVPPGVTVKVKGEVVTQQADGSYACDIDEDSPLLLEIENDYPVLGIVFSAMKGYQRAWFAMEAPQAVRWH